MPLAPVAILAALLAAAQAPEPPTADTRAAELEAAITAAKTLSSKSNAAATLAAWEDAWKLADAGPPGDYNRYVVLKQLTGLAVSMKKYDDAEKWLQLALHYRETQVPQPESQHREDTLLLAYLCKARDDFERGIFILQRVMSLTVKEYGFESTEVADLLTRMADFEAARKEFARAEGVLRTAIDIRRKKLGEEHWSLVPDLEKLGSVLNQQRKYDQAEVSFSRALTLRERSMSQEIDLVNALDGLAYAQFGQSKFVDAEPNYHRMAAIWTSTAGATHPMVAATLDKLVVFYRKQNREEDARAAWKAACVIRAHNLAEGVAREAGEQLVRNEIDEAVVLYRRAAALLDAAEPLHAELRAAINGQLTEIRALTRKSPGRKAAAPKKSG